MRRIAALLLPCAAGASTLTADVNAAAVEKNAVNTFQQKDCTAPVAGEAVLENGTLPAYSVTILAFDLK